MRYRELKQSSVHFNEREHSYTIEDVSNELTGVTSIIKAVLFPNKYAGIPQSILEQASRRGSAIHFACQQTDLLGTTLEDFLAKKEAGLLDTLDYPQETEHYLRIKAGHGIKMIANEYLVSDELEFATMIDCIDSKGNLYDIKTTAELDTEYLSWQLSLCAYLFEKQNPHLKAGKLYGIWLRSRVSMTDPTNTIAKLVEVKRKSKEEIEAVLQAYREGQEREDLIYKAVSDDDRDLLQVANIESQILDFKEAIKQLEAMKKESLMKVEQAMKQAGVKKLETERVLITLVEPSKSKTLDSKRLKEEHPDLAEAYSRETERKGHVKITLRTA